MMTTSARGTRRTPHAALCVAVLLGVACGDDSSATGDGHDGGPRDEIDAALPAASPGALTYHGTAKPIVKARCTPCHREGGIAPFSLEGYENLKSVGGAVQGAVTQRIMPPLPPDTRDCRSLSDARVMPDEERRALSAWVDAGMPEGVPGDAPTKALPSFVLDAPLGNATSEAVFDGEYEAPATGQDEYRCMVVDPGWTSAHTLEAIAATPDLVPMVHHVIVFAQLPEQADAVDALDAAADGPGYPCVGGAGFTGALALGGYVPGAMPRAFAGGATVTLPAGTRFVLQMHYNFLTTRGADRTTLRFWETDTPSALRPSAVVLIDTDFVIPAGAPDYSTTATGRIRANPDAGLLTPLGRTTGTPGLAYGVGAHMHTRGKSIRIDLVRANGKEECLLDIPHWDFRWQGQYRFAEPIRLDDGDDVRLTCTWDNSDANQPVVDGMRLDPKELHWGEGTHDEMCLGSVLMTSK